MVKTISWMSQNGKKIEVTIEIEHKTQDKTVNLDGDIVNLGKETIDLFSVIIRADGKYLSRGYNAPEVLDPKFYSNYAKLTAAGAYARVGDNYINKEQYDLIMAAIAEINSQLEITEEYKAVKAQEIQKEHIAQIVDEREDSEYERSLKNGFCPKCGSYCYGDCEA